MAVIHVYGYVPSMFPYSHCVPVHLAHQVWRLAIVSKARFSPHNSWFIDRSDISENYLKRMNTFCPQLSSFTTMIGGCHKFWQLTLLTDLVAQPVRKREVVSSKLRVKDSQHTSYHLTRTRTASVALKGERRNYNLRFDFILSSTHKRVF